MLPLMCYKTRKLYAPLTHIYLLFILRFVETLVKITHIAVE